MVELIRLKRDKVTCPRKVLGAERWGGGMSTGWWWDGKGELVKPFKLSLPFGAEIMVASVTERKTLYYKS